jgi:PAS domain S-box-containing protein
MSENFGNKEELLSANSLFVSETNEKGIITYVNDGFARIAGYTKKELIGQAHNFIRHPFMPQAAFADLWTTVQKGDTWDGIVINKTKSGGYYWVKANVFKSQNPDGSVKYISVRVKPSNKEIADVIKLYPTL